MRTCRPIRYPPGRSRRSRSSPIAIEAGYLQLLEKYKRQAERKMAALDSLPPELRKAVTEANYSVHDVLVLADHIKRYGTNFAPRLVREVMDNDEKLRKQRQR